MDPAYIKPFIASIQNVFATMLQMPVTTGEPRLKTDRGAENDISGIIGLSGAVRGSVVLSFPTQTAERVVAIFAGQSLQVGTPDFADAVGELVNMISGGAKALFPGNSKASISCPSVVIGQNHTLARQSDIPCIVIPCTTDCGPLTIEIALKVGEDQPVAKAAAPARANA